MTYSTIVADPPWDYGSQNLGRRTDAAGNVIMHGTGAVDSYERMSLADLSSLPVGAVTAANCHLYLWTTNGFLEAAFGVARAWGFKPKTVLTWLKVKKDDPTKASMKTGYYFRGATEHVLFCVRGSLPLSTREGIPTGFMWPRAAHSVKPDSFYEVVERASPGPYLDLFARRERPGWDVWGDQAPNSIVLPSA